MWTGRPARVNIVVIAVSIPDHRDPEDSRKHRTVKTHPTEWNEDSGVICDPCQAQLNSEK
jgi:hypothetical protein